MLEQVSRQNVTGGVPKKTYITHESWGQPPASQYRFRIDGTRMYGVPISDYTMGHPKSPDTAIEADLREELKIWDSLSDEAFLNFEDSLD